jgi:hypothetical protein
LNASRPYRLILKKSDIVWQHATRFDYVDPTDPTVLLLFPWGLVSIHDDAGVPLNSFQLHNIFQCYRSGNSYEGSGSYPVMTLPPTRNLIVQIHSSLALVLALQR